MKIDNIKFMAGLLGAVAAVCTGSAFAEDAKPLDFSGVGWVQYGQIGHSSGTMPNNYQGNTTQNSGAQISVSTALTENLLGAVGLGVLEGHAMAGQAGTGGNEPVLEVFPYIAQAEFSYSLGPKNRPDWQLTGGLFPYNYNPDVKDLGLYLLRGPVYPGVVMSGFETKEVLPIANALGFWLRNNSGAFRQDLLLLSETELKPLFDISLAYIAQMKVGDYLTVGGGVDLYRLIPTDYRVTYHPFFPATETDSTNQDSRNTIWVDKSGAKPDTTIIGFNGTKVMANAALDIKALLGLSGRFGPEDLRLYGEAAVIGLDFDKAHKALYGSLANRIPVMAGFNIPMFGYLDHLSLEVEYYGAEFKDDLTKYIGTHTNRVISPIPATDSTTSATVPAITRDNFKWALHAAKTIEGHFKVSAQVANDHFRPGGTVNLASLESAMTTPKDWYWMTKIAYFF